MKYPRTLRHFLIIMLLTVTGSLFPSLESGFTAERDQQNFSWVPLVNVIEAAERGNADAQYSLGTKYAKGRGVSQNFVVAYMWLNLASAGSTGEVQKDAATVRDEVAGKMTAQQIAEAQRLAREWRPKEGN